MRRSAALTIVAVSLVAGLALLQPAAPAFAAGLDQGIGSGGTAGPQVNGGRNKAPAQIGVQGSNKLTTGTGTAGSAVGTRTGTGVGPKASLHLSGSGAGVAGGPSSHGTVGH